MDRTVAKLASSPSGPILLGVAYFCCAVLALTLTSGGAGVATVWPPSGILLATLLLVPRRTIGRYLGAALVASWLANVVAGSGALVAAGYSAANMIEAIIATALLRRRGGCTVSFVDVQGVGCFVIATFAAAAVSASMALLVDPPGGWHFFISWFATVWLGMLLVSPPLMVAFEVAASIRKMVPAVRVRSLAQIAALAAAICACTFFQSSYPILFLPMMLAAAAVLQGGALGGIVVVVVATVFGSWALAQGQGPVSLIDGDHETQVLFFQAYLVALFLSALPMARLLAGKEQLRIELAERVRLLDQAEQAGNIGHWRLNPGDQTIYWSPEVYRIHGMTDGTPPAIGDAIDFYHPEDQPLVAEAVARATAEGQPFNFAARIIRQDGSIRHVVSRGERDYSSKDNAIGLFGIIQDVTDQVQARESLAAARDLAERSAKDALALADTDPLTGLANRRKLMRQLSAALSDARRDQAALTIVMFDIDHFKSINDGFGHDIGDRVLKHVAHIAARGLRGDDLIGRYGGEEFILLLPDTSTAAAVRIAERVRAAVANGDGPALPNVTISLGVATATPGDTADDVLKRADIALYVAKESGRNQLSLAA